MSTNKNLAQTQKAIIFIDEIDKIHLKGDLKHDAFIQGIQDALLTTLDGSPVNISATGHRFMPTSSRINVDTTGILFICAGAFAGLSEIIQDRRSQNRKTTMGFNLANNLNKQEIKSSPDSNPQIH
ncbi:MAG: AAA family ATPase [Cyanobacteria bacterium P01_G01_bin.67]